MEKVTLDKKMATALLKTVDADDNGELDSEKVHMLTVEMDAGRWNPERSANDPLGVTHESRQLINGRHRLVAFLSSRLKTINIYVQKDV